MKFEKGRGACVGWGYKFIITQKGVCSLNHATILIGFHAWGYIAKHAYACWFACLHAGMPRRIPPITQSKYDGVKLSFSLFGRKGVHACGGQNQLL